jgi:hypothetical protein
MTADELQNIFRFQTTADADYVPSDSVDFILVSDRGRLLNSCPVAKISDILPRLDGFLFEGYSNRTPIFIKPEV